jgi:hypothetical protein
VKSIDCVYVGGSIGGVGAGVHHYSTACGISANRPIASIIFKLNPLPGT